MQTKEYHIKLPKHLSVRLEDVVMERYGYKARGGITLLILEALEEKLNPNKNKLRSEKNELARLEQDRVNSYNQVVNDVSILLPHILTYKQQSNDDEDAYFITRPNLEKAIGQRTGYTDKRAIKRRITLLLNSGILTGWDYYNGRYENFMINQEKCKGVPASLT